MTITGIDITKFQNDLYQLAKLFQLEETGQSIASALFQFNQMLDSDHSLFNDIENKVFNQIKPQDLRERPTLLKGMQLFLSRYPKLSKEIYLDQENKFPVHTMLLKAASVTADHLLDDIGERDSLELEENQDIIKVVQSFVEKGDTSEISEKNVFKVYHYAHKTEIPDLERACKEYIFNNFKNIGRPFSGTIRENFNWAKSFNCSFLIYLFFNHYYFYNVLFMPPKEDIQDFINLSIKLKIGPIQWSLDAEHDIKITVKETDRIDLKVVAELCRLIDFKTLEIFDSESGIDSAVTLQLRHSNVTKLILNLQQQSSKSLFLLLESCSKLRYLKLNNTNSFYGSFFEDLSENGREIEELDLKDFRIDSVEQLNAIRTIPVKKLHLSCNGLFTESILDKFAESACLESLTWRHYQQNDYLRIFCVFLMVNRSITSVFLEEIDDLLQIAQTFLQMAQTLGGNILFLRADPERLSPPSIYGNVYRSDYVYFYGEVLEVINDVKTKFESLDQIVLKRKIIADRVYYWCEFSGKIKTTPSSSLCKIM